MTEKIFMTTRAHLMFEPEAICSLLRLLNGCYNLVFAVRFCKKDTSYSPLRYKIPSVTKKNTTKIINRNERKYGIFWKKNTSACEYTKSRKEFNDATRRPSTLFQCPQSRPRSALLIPCENQKKGLLRNQEEIIYPYQKS